MDPNRPYFLPNDATSNHVGQEALQQRSRHPQQDEGWRPPVYPTAVFQQPTYNAPYASNPPMNRSTYPQDYATMDQLIDVDVNYTSNTYPRPEIRSPPRAVQPSHRQASGDSYAAAQSFSSFSGRVIEDGSGAYKFLTNIVDDSGYIEQVVVNIGMGGIKVMDKDQKAQKKLFSLERLHKWGIRDSDVIALSFQSLDGSGEDVFFRADKKTTGSMLDAITATCVQLCELKGEPAPVIDTENKDGMGVGWIKKCMTSDKPEGNIEAKISKDHWRPDVLAKCCSNCDAMFTTIRRRHHCRMCGEIFCDACSRKRAKLLGESSTPERVCDNCFGVYEKQSAPTVQGSKQKEISPEELARKLQEDYDLNYAQALCKKTTQQNQLPREVQVLTSCSIPNQNLADGHQQPRYIENREGNAYTGPPHLWTTEVGPPNTRYPSDTHVGVNDGLREQEVACPSCRTLLQVFVGPQDAPVECGVCGSHFLVAGLCS